MSKYWLSPGVYVPHSAIYRDHCTAPLDFSEDTSVEYMQSLIRVPPLHKAWTALGAESWHGLNLPDPKDVVVVGARRLHDLAEYDEGVFFGWHVRFKRTGDRLVRVPTQLVLAMHSAMMNNEHYKDSALVRLFPDCSLEGKDFSQIANERFCAVKRALSERAGFPPPPRKVRRRSLVKDHCALCLENGWLHPSPCCGLSGAVCATCSDRTRGMCVLCDRHKLGAKFVCGSCDAVVKLSSYGFPCFVCHQGLLCQACYNRYGECRDCE